MLSRVQKCSLISSPLQPSLHSSIIPGGPAFLLIRRNILAVFSLTPCSSCRCRQATISLSDMMVKVTSNIKRTCFIFGKWIIFTVGNCNRSSISLTLTKICASQLLRTQQVKQSIHHTLSPGPFPYKPMARDFGHG